VNSMFVSHAQIEFGAFLITLMLVALSILVLLIIGWIVGKLREVAAVRWPRINKKGHKMPDSTHSLPASGRLKSMVVVSAFFIIGVTIGLIIGVLISSNSVEPGPASYLLEPREVVFIVLANQDIQEGTFIEQDMFVLSWISPDMVIDTWIVGNDEEDLKTRVVGCQARFDIPRALPLTSTLLDCP
jgi:hypothetical protein